MAGFQAALEHLGGPDRPVFVLGWVNDDMVESLVRRAPTGTRFIFQQTVEDMDAGKAQLERMRAAAGC